MSLHRLPLRPRRTRRPTLLAALIVMSSLVVSIGIVAPPAMADSYPSWEDVQAARSSEASKQAEVARITQLIAGLQAKARAAEAVTQQRSAENAAAQQALSAGKARADALAASAAQLKAKAEKSRQQAGMLAGRFARLGGQSLTGMLLSSDSSGADLLLQQLSTMGKLSTTVNRVYVSAQQDMNEAKAVSDQAASAKEALTALADTAKKALQAAADAQKAMIASLAAQTQHEDELKAQLASLTSSTATTEKQYKAGVAARARAAAARAAAALRAAAAARAAQGGSSYTAPVSSNARSVARELMDYVNSGRLVGSYPDHIMEIRWIADGQAVPNCGIDTKVLQAILIAVRAFGSAGVSDINRRCTGQIEGAGIYSQHYMDGGGHAVDFYSLGGRGLNGADRNSLTLIRLLDRVMPYGSGLGQRECRLNAGNEPNLVNFQDFYDTCNHLHVNAPV